MKHTLIELPFEKNALEPFMSAETIDFHYGKHHLTYVNTLNSLIEWTHYEDMSLEDIIKNSEGKIYNNAAQIWNHNLFWKSFCYNLSDRSSHQQSLPIGISEELLLMIEGSFGSFDEMKSQFKTESLGRFGSGWVWLVQKGPTLEIYSTPNAENPLTLWGRALLGCDVWEHSYYIDTRNDRGQYIENFFHIIDWKKISERLEK